MVAVCVLGVGLLTWTAHSRPSQGTLTSLDDLASFLHLLHLKNGILSGELQITSSQRSRLPHPYCPPDCRYS